MAYVDFPDGLEGQKKRKAYWLSEDGITLIAGWRRQGLSIQKITKDLIGVSQTTFWNWYRECPKLKEACCVALEVCNVQVEESLFKRACGYDYYEERWDLIEGELRLAQRFKKHMPPDTKAIAMWLYNRMPNRWRSMQEPLEATQYKETVKQIVVAMRDVAENGKSKELEVASDDTES